MNAVDRFMKLFGANVRAARMSIGYSQAELASHAHVSIKMISGIERGVENASLRLVSKVAKALGVTIKELTPGI